MRQAERGAVRRRRIAIVGAGIVGLSCAAYLLHDGHAVTLFDPLPPGEGCSLGNAGVLGLSRSMPLAHPGLIPRLPRMLLDPSSPLSVKWGYLPRLAPWLWRFALNCRAGRVEATSRSLHGLLALAFAAHEELAREAGARELIRASGWLYVYEKKSSFEWDEAEQRLRARRGVRFERLEGEALRRLEPTLGPRARYGVFMPDDGHVTDPLRLSRSIAALIASRGGTFRRSRVRALARRREGWRIEADEGSAEADAVVIAAGAWSKPLARMLSSAVPLESERGYHLTLPSPGAAPRLPVLHGEGRFVVTPMETGLRLAGTTEFAGLDAPPDWSRADILAEQARALFPGLNTAAASRWAGERPATPDSLPVIAPAPRDDGAFLAFGHGHLGLTLGPVTGKIVADLIAGRAPLLPLEPFAATRFARV